MATPSKPLLIEDDVKEEIDLSIVVPAYNEQDRIVTMMVETTDYLNLKSKQGVIGKTEIIIVNDGSTDNTL